MSSNKYIGTKEAVLLTGLSTQEIYNLIHEGTLPARKAPKSGWRISPQDLADLGLIQEKSSSTIEESQIEDCVSYIADEEHYTQVFKRMAEVKYSLKIATANLKNFNVPVMLDDEIKFIPVCEFFLSLVENGVHVQVVCMKPFDFYNKAKDTCPRLLDNPLFELRYNGHNHMKIFIFDDESAYIGSANITSAAIGKRSTRHRNYEAGMLVWGNSILQDPLNHFERVWNDPDILKHTWSRFIKMAKKREKEINARY